MVIGIIDIGLSNFKSVRKALDKLNAGYKVVTVQEDFEDLSKVIFPGVGSYPAAMRRLDQYQLVNPIKDHINAGKSYLGICLGMQLLSDIGLEGGYTKGLGILDADVVRMEPAYNEPLPHIGWNQIDHDGKGLFEGISRDADFYFVHSYYMKLREPLVNFAVNYGGLHTCFVQKGNVIGAQFHPEKSQKVGLRFLENFLNA